MQRFQVHQKSGTTRMVPLPCDFQCLAPGAIHHAPGTWSLCALSSGQWSVVSGRGSVVSSQWSVASGQLSCSWFHDALCSGQWSCDGSAVAVRCVVISVDCNPLIWLGYHMVSPLPHIVDHLALTRPPCSFVPVDSALLFLCAGLVACSWAQARLRGMNCA